MRRTLKLSDGLVHVVKRVDVSETTVACGAPVLHSAMAFEQGAPTCFTCMAWDEEEERARERRQIEKNLRFATMYGQPMVSMKATAQAVGVDIDAVLRALRHV